MTGISTLLFASCIVFPLEALPASDPQDLTSSRAVAFPVRAMRCPNGNMRVDGALKEDAWAKAPVAEGFVQQDPYEGMPATEKTTVRVVFDDENIYIGIKAYDEQPQKIVARLSRRDQDCPSDWLYVGFDSYNDRRTAFVFGINAAGTKRDMIFYNDTDQDANWDAIWDAAVQIGEDGWTAEIAIPWNQLRFSNDREKHSWGFQAMRFLCRKAETSFLYPVPKNTNRFVSLFGKLEGIERIPPPRKSEILPYTVGSIDSYADCPDDPFRKTAIFSTRIGADVKYRLSTDFTLDVAVNPDFGEVEQDPSEFNLTAYESYFEEKRPFFMEGLSIFQYRLMFGDEASERLFYSRRIGRAPQFYALNSKRFSNTDSFYELSPRFSTILGAAKMTGKTANGLSIGFLEAVTDKEESEVELPSGERVAVAVEPMTNYAVFRVQKDLNEGRSTVGCILTNVARDISSPDLEYLNRSASTGGIDFSHRFRKDEYAINGRILTSRISGSTEAIAEAQCSSARYFQRPDAEHVDFDPARTSLQGYAMVLDGGRYGGRRLNFLLGFLSRSPGFETNDIGYMQEADENLAVIWVGYRMPKPWKAIKNLGLNCNIYRGYDFGSNLIASGGNVNGWMDFTNNWSAFAGIERSGERLSTSVTRGGAMLLVPGYVSGWLGFKSDNRRTLQMGISSSFNFNDEGFHSYSLSPWLAIRPSGRFEARASLSYSSRENDLQYLDTILGRCILGHLDMDIASLTARLNYTATPELSIQLYAMPYIAAGRYSDFREVVEPRADRYEDRFASYDYLAESDSPDFSFKEMRSNLVIRWEWSTGSSLYLIWSRGATDFEESCGSFDPGRDAARLLSTAGDNTFLVKMSKWFSL